MTGARGSNQRPKAKPCDMALPFLPVLLLLLENERRSKHQGAGKSLVLLSQECSGLRKINVPVYTHTENSKPRELRIVLGICKDGAL